VSKINNFKTKPYTWVQFFISAYNKQLNRKKAWRRPFLAEISCYIIRNKIKVYKKILTLKTKVNIKVYFFWFGFILIYWTYIEKKGVAPPIFDMLPTLRPFALSEFINNLIFLALLPTTNKAILPCLSISVYLYKPQCGIQPSWVLSFERSFALSFQNILISMWTSYRSS